MKQPTRTGKTKPKTMGKGNRFNDVDLILRSARSCFQRYGVEKTRMEDIAKLAGISRPLLYKLFIDRQALRDAAVNYEVERLTRIQNKKMQLCKNFNEVLIEGSIAGIELARKDQVLMDLLIHSSIDHLQVFLLDSSQPAHKLTLSLWQPYFDKAREKGELPAHIDDDDLMEWIMCIQHVFLMRSEVKPTRIRELMEVFFCPIFSPGAGKALKVKTLKKTLLSP